MSDPILLTPTEAARALGIGRSKLYELLQAGVLESSTSAPADASLPTRCPISWPDSAREDQVQGRRTTPGREKTTRAALPAGGLGEF